jgi:hypothetical protein
LLPDTFSSDVILSARRACPEQSEGARRISILICKNEILRRFASTQKLAVTASARRARSNLLGVTEIASSACGLLAMTRNDWQVSVVRHIADEAIWGSQNDTKV